VVGRRDLGIHNIRCWMNSAKGLAALCCADEELAYEAIRAEFGLEDQLGRGILDDGFWWECSWGYHFYTMLALWPLTEAVRHIGIDVYGDRYKAFFDAPLNFAFPGRRLPALNDSGRGRVLEGRAIEPYELALARWGDLRYAGLLENDARDGRLALCFGVPELDPEPPVMRGSVNFPASGVAILRSDELEPTVVTLDYGPHGGGHGHPDKLGIILHGAGRELAPDPGSIQYGAPLHTEWFKTTLSHNTVLVDSQPQAPCTGELLEFRANGVVQVASARADDAYPGVRFSRTIALLSGSAVVDICRVESDGEHVYDWTFHCAGSFASPLPFEGLPAPLGESNGYQHVSSPRIARTGSGWTACWHDQGAGVCLAMAGAPGSEVFAGNGPGNPPPLMLPMVIVRQKAKGALFTAAYVVYRGDAPDVRISASASAANALQVSVVVNGDCSQAELSCP